MKTGHNTQLTRQIGEHLVVSKLGRMGIMAAPFAGNVPYYDLLASDLSGHSMPIQVKAINGPSWQFSVTAFLEIEFDGDNQIVKGKKILPNPNLVCVFVLLRSDERDDFYILTFTDLQDHFLNTYKSRRRPGNPKSTHCAIWPKELTAYQNKWELITSHFNPIGK
jgi:hypothetical protein